LKPNIAKELDIMSNTKFNELLEDRLKDDKISYIDAIVDICAKTGLEIESVPSLLNNRTRKILRNEAANLNMLKKKGATLPV
jgi:hypothetical protein